MADRTSEFTLDGYEINDQFLHMIIHTADTNVDRTDYVNLNSITGLPGTTMIKRVIKVSAYRDYAAVGATKDPWSWDYAATSNVDRITCDPNSSGADEKTRLVYIIARCD